jgi:hypothetical protein
MKNQVDNNNQGDEEDDENEVDLAKTMWLVLRKNRSANNILR